MFRIEFGQLLKFSILELKMELKKMSQEQHCYRDGVYNPYLSPRDVAPSVFSHWWCPPPTYFPFPRIVTLPNVVLHSEILPRGITHPSVLSPSQRWRLHALPSPQRCYLPGDAAPQCVFPLMVSTLEVVHTMTPRNPPRPQSFVLPSFVPRPDMFPFWQFPSLEVLPPLKCYPHSQVLPPPVLSA